MAGSQRLLEMGSAAEAADQYRLAEMAAMCFAEALDVDPSDPKATYGLEQSMQAVEVLKAAEVATVEAVELAAMAARAAAPGPSPTGSASPNTTETCLAGQTPNRLTRRRWAGVHSCSL